MTSTLFKNGRIYSLAQAKPFDWLLTKDGRISALGYYNDMPGSAGQELEVVDLEKKTIFPAFTDAHHHLTYSALLKNQISLDGLSSKGSTLDKLKEYAGNYALGQWVYGSGYNRNLWTDGQPTARDLDNIFPDNPAAFYSKDLHSLWANSRALEIAGIRKNSIDLANGRIERDNRGNPTGLLFEEACKLVLDKIHPVTTRVLSEAVENYTRDMFALGITTVHTMETYSDFKRLESINSEMQLPIRAHCFVFHDALEELIADQRVSYSGDEFLQLAGIKFFTDGSLGSQTASMIEPYGGRPEDYGLDVIDETLLMDRVSLAAKKKLASTIHAIGDKAVQKTLRVFESAHDIYRTNKLLGRIEHAQLMYPEMITKMASLNLAASMQPVHIADDVLISEQFWGTRSAHAYPIRLLQNVGILLAFGSDAPVADPDPLKGMYSAIFRRYLFDGHNPVWHPELAVNIETAIQAYTKGPAASVASLFRQGTLAPGKVADFVVLSNNLLRMSAEQLLETQVLKTISAGEIVFDRENHS